MTNDTREAEDLNPASDPDRWDALVGRIMRASAPELARRRSPVARLWGWAAPVVAAAATVAALAIGALASAGPRGSELPPTLADAVLPSEVVTWLDSGEAPTIEDLFADLDRMQVP